MKKQIISLLLLTSLSQADGFIPNLGGWEC